MIALLQRVNFAKVEVAAQLIGNIGRGILAFIAIEPQDSKKHADRLAARILGYRIFPDAADRMNLSVRESAGEILLVPQFTLAANTKKGMRPSFTSAAEPELGEELFTYFVERTKQLFPHVATGKFGANMQITLCNDGPITFILNTR